MPRALGKRHQEDVRMKIQASQIINRLQAAFEGAIELTQTQVNIGKTLLDKALPDLKAIEHSGGIEHDITVNKIEIEIVDTTPTSSA